jgi:NodT family efflux transporter outer membrane factor (OMF) lipoprotein
MTILLMLTTVGCMIGPNYRKPVVPVPAAFKELPQALAETGVKWKAAQPNDSTWRGKWWEIFADPELNALEEQVRVSNQLIALAEAQYRGARALVGSARAGLFPTVSAGASGVQSSGITNASSKSVSGPPPAVTAYLVPVDFNWEFDLFGRIRRGVAASVASAQASAADLEGVRLSMHAELALDYFLLHGLDAEIQLLQKTVAGYQTTLDLTEKRYRQGVVSGVDVAQAKTQLESTQAAAIDLTILRAQIEHALAVLVGKPPQQFAIAAATIPMVPPEIPVGLPSELLERRPDIAATERRIAAANAQIGVALAGFFPTLSLSGTSGYQGSVLSSLFSLPNRIWSLGGSLLETIFAGGKRRAASQQALAAYDAAIANYRETVLTAFQEVEDNLAALRILADEAKYQDDAVAAAEHSLYLAKNRYLSGITTYFEVVTAQSVALTNERLAVGLLTRQLTASINLIKALGGGWHVAGQLTHDPLTTEVTSSLKKTTVSR